MQQRKLMIFISSTFVDLKEERQAAVQAILKAGHIPAGMELFTSGDKSQLKAIYNWIDECDVYMLILGGRYGSIEQNSKLSYTELEYDYAKSIGKPCFSVVITDDELESRVKQHGQSVLELENRKALDDFRKKVMSNVCAFFSDIKDVKLSAHESLGDYSMDPSLSGWVSGKEIPDVSSMQHELLELRSENERLKKTIATKTRGSTATIDTTFEELENILQATEITVPAKFGKDEIDEDFNVSLNHILIKQSAKFITGVTNAYGNTDLMDFYYYTIAPKLQIHGLVENEKVTGARHRRFYLTKEGQKYLSWVAKKATAVAKKK